MFHYRLQSFQTNYLNYDLPEGTPAKYIYIPRQLIGVYSSFELAQKCLNSLAINEYIVYVIDKIKVNSNVSVTTSEDIWIPLKGSNNKFYHFTGEYYSTVSKLIIECEKGYQENKKVTIN